MSEKYVYQFGNGKAEGDVSMKSVLGGKGAGLAEMCNLGLPVPPGLTISTAACNHFFSQNEEWPATLWDEILAGLKQVESASGKIFGDAENPLLVSVRSGALSS